MEIRAASTSGMLRCYVNQTEQANLTYNAIYLTLVERHFRSKNQARSNGGHSGAAPPHFFVEKIYLHILKNKQIASENVFCPETKPDYGPAKNGWLGESC